jgi:hypothetical protein
MMMMMMMMMMVEKGVESLYFEGKAYKHKSTVSKF